MPAVLFIGAGRHQVPYIRRVREEFGYRVVAVDARADAPGLAIADRGHAASAHEDLVRIAREEAVDGVMTVASDRAVPQVAAVAEDAGLPSIGRRTAQLMTDKVAMRERFREAGVPQPAFGSAGSRDELVTLAGEIGFPAVLKPADSSGQRGIAQVGSLDDVLAWADEAFAASSTGRVILERFHDLPEVNVLAVVRGGAVSIVSLSDRVRPEGVGFGVATLHRFPTQVGEADADAVRDVATRAIEATGLRDGVAYPQVLAGGPGQTYMVEIASRIPGGRMGDVPLYGAGVDLLDVVLRTAVGAEVPDLIATPQFERPLAIRFLTSTPGHLPVGTVAAWEGLDDVRAAPGVLDAMCWLEPGMEIRPVQVDGDRKGFAIAAGETVEEAIRRADDALGRIRVRVAP